MAIQSASAKLYTGIRVWCVDKNISAALTSSFSVRGGGLNANPIASRLIRIIADIESVPSVSLTNERYKTYGFKSDMVARNSVICKFPTYFQIDVDKLQLPEGVTCTVQLEEGWITEGEFPETTRAPSPRIDNFFTFRTPYNGLSFMKSYLTYTLLDTKLRRATAAFTSAFSPVVSAKLNAKGFTDLQTAFNINAIIGYKRFFAAQLQSKVEGNEPGGVPFLIGNGYEYPPGSGFEYLNPSLPWHFPGILRIRETAIPINQLVATLTLPEFLIVLEAAATSNSNFEFSLDAMKYKGIVAKTITSNVTTSIVSVKTARVISNSSIALSMSSTAVKKASGNISMTAESSMTCDASGALTMVYNTNLIAGNTIELPLNGTVNATVDWGDGNTSTVTTAGNLSHTYASKGTYTVKVLGLVTHYGPEIATAPAGIAALTTVYGFGQGGITSLKWAFINATNLTIVPDQLPASVTSLYQTFRGCTSFNGTIPNGGSINSWNTSNITDLTGTFLNCSSFNKSINSWNTSAVTLMTSTFQGCTIFNQPLSSWDTHNVTAMNSMFSGASAFNQSLTRSGNIWDTYNVTTTAGMFVNAIAFNQDLSTWRMNQNRDFGSMFSGATAFNQSLGSWTLYSGIYSVTMSGMLNNCGMNTTNYSATLNGWKNTVYANGGVPGFVSLGATGRTYNSSASAARAYLVTYLDHPSGGRWTITGDSLV